MALSDCYLKAKDAYNFFPQGAFDIKRLVDVNKRDEVLVFPEREAVLYSMFWVRMRRWLEWRHV